MSKTRNNSKGELKATTKAIKADFKKFTETIRKEAAAFREEWASKFNTLRDNCVRLEDRFKQIVTATGQQLAQLNANSQVHSDVLERIDINVQALAQMGVEIFGRFEQIDHYLQKSGNKFDDLSQEDLALIKKQAQESYEATMVECFRVVEEQRQALLEEKRAEAEEAKKKAIEEAEKAEKAKKEAADVEETATAEEALHDAESSSRLAAEPGGQGSEIPAGAEVFGG